MLNETDKKPEDAEMPGTPKFGVNYIPSKRWLHFWIDWDENEVREDLAAIASMGFDHVRAHLIWPYFQTNPTVMNRTALKNLERFAELCGEYKLGFALSLFTGWMSGFHFLPSWLSTWQGWRGIFTDPQIIEAEKFYIKEISSAVAQSPYFIGYDLGNELSCVTPLDKACGIAEGDRWSDLMLAECRRYAPEKLHSNGVDHQPWFSNRSFSRENLANTGDMTALHCWIEFTGALKRYGADGIGSIQIAPYMARLASAYSDAPNRKMWIQEFGASSLWMDAEKIPEFAESTLRAILATENVWGITWWCSHDVDRRFTGYNPLEYDLGLFDVNNNPKPAALTFKKLIAEVRNGYERPIPPDTALVIDESFTPEDDGCGWRNASRYMELASAGRAPQLILEKNASDGAYLRSRGIKSVIR